MTTVTGLTAERMLEIEAASVVAGTVDENGDLILTQHDGTTNNAGHVKGSGPETYLDHGNKSGAFSLDTSIAETNVLTMTGDTQITLTGSENGRTIYIVAFGAYILTVAGMVVPSGRAVGIKIAGAWEIYIIGSPGDLTAPVAGTLSVTFPGSDSSLVVAGAADYGMGLHAQPYSFSKDNGATWSGWQSSATYLGFTALTPNTSYTFKHRVRDAVGNITNGAPVTLTTPVAQSWSTLFADTFTGTAGVIHGRTPTTGTGPWARLGSNDITIDGAGIAKYDVHGQSADAIVDIVDQNRVRWTVAYDLSAHTTGGSTATVSPGVGTNSATSNQIYVSLACGSSGNNAVLSFVDNAAGVWSMAVAAGQSLTGLPAVGTLVLDLDLLNKVGTVSINGTVVANITGDTALTAMTAFLRLTNSTAKVDSVTFERYGS